VVWPEVYCLNEYFLRPGFLGKKTIEGGVLADEFICEGFILQTMQSKPF
jgi:hypothetical protein